MDLASLNKVLAEVSEERQRQEAKWGEQNHPDLSPEYAGFKVELVHEEMGVPMAHTARHRVENLARRKTLGYADIALEEFAEAIEAAALGDTAELRKELVQTAAVLVAWVECIDRRRSAGDVTTTATTTDNHTRSESPGFFFTAQTENGTERIDSKTGERRVGADEGNQAGPDHEVVVIDVQPKPRTVIIVDAPRVCPKCRAGDHSHHQLGSICRLVLSGGGRDIHCACTELP